jgi:16S rRNA (cytidine1402-2'-O)-methyltransferase
MEIKKGTLYITGTPIGNLGDLSPRALEVLSGVDFIAAEDTRVSLKLLTKFGVRKPLISCREHNIRETAKGITEQLQSGKSCALISDAGMPCISDPGAQLIALCREQGIKTEVVPGPSALVAALSLSGFECQRFSFEGFLSVNAKQRKERLTKIKDYDGLLIFYEAPHKLIRTLTDLLESLGDCETAVCRELTKLHEEVIHGTLSEVLVHFSAKAPKGEFVLVLGNCGDGSPQPPEYTIADAANIAAELISQGQKPADACKSAAKQTGLPKSEIYKKILKGEKNYV